MPVLKKFKTKCSYTKEIKMGKLKRLSTEIVASLWLEPMSFNQIERELEEKREVIENMIDLLVADNIITQKGTLYQLTVEGKEYFSY